jgi:hypothetical protein
VGTRQASAWNRPHLKHFPEMVARGKLATMRMMIAHDCANPLHISLPPFYQVYRTSPVASSSHVCNSRTDFPLSRLVPHVFLSVDSVLKKRTLYWGDSEEYPNGHDASCPADTSGNVQLVGPRAPACRRGPNLSEQNQTCLKGPKPRTLFFVLWGLSVTFGIVFKQNLLDLLKRGSF